MLAESVEEILAKKDTVCEAKTQRLFWEQNGQALLPVVLSTEKETNTTQEKEFREGKTQNNVNDKLVSMNCECHASNCYQL